jgi:DNA-binding CsgD family transcriptional regulator
MIPNSLQQKIDNAIAEIATVADRLPGVVTIHDLRDWSVVWMSAPGLKLLNLTPADIAGKNIDQYHNQYFNPEDAKDYTPKLLGWLERDVEDETLTYFQQVRFYAQDDWVWHVSAVKVLLRDDDRKPLLVVAMSFPIDAMHHMTAKAARLLEENNFLRKNFHHFATLTKRERDILGLLALGKSSAETAETLFIATTTVETHRKNIKQKLNTTSYYELGMYARAFDLI